MSKRPPLQDFNVSYAAKGKAAAVSVPLNKQMKVYAVCATNSCGAIQAMALCVRLAGPRLYTVSDSQTPDAILDPAPLNAFSTVANDGFLVQANKRFNLLGLTVSVAQSGSPVYAYEYFNGTAFVALPLLESPSTYGVGDNYVVFNAPSDWVPGTTATVGGESDLYTIRVRATTAGGQIVVATSAWAARFLEYAPIANDGAKLSQGFDELNPLLLESGEGLMPYFSTPNVKNMLSGYYAISE